MIQQSIEVGPIHDFLPGVMKLGIGLNGDVIESVDAEFGYLSKNLLKDARGKFVLDAQIRLNRIEPENALVMDTMLSSCVEEATQTEVPNRAVWIRDVVNEVSELSGAIRYLALMSRRMDLAALTQVLLRHREDLVDLLELLTGSRFGYDYIIPGGVRFDLSHGFSERLEKWVKTYQEDFGRIESMFYWISYQKNYLKKIGNVIDHGKLGFVSRANKEETRLGLVSHVESRLNFVLNETLQICERLKKYLNENIVGEFRVKLNPQVKKTVLTAQHETMRGAWVLNLELNADLNIKDISVETPSDQTIAAIPEALLDENLDDLPLILQSLNFSVTEVDK